MPNLNMTQVCSMTTEQHLAYVNNAYVLPRVIGAVVVVFLFLCIIGMYRLKNSQRIFFEIVGITAIIAFVIIGAMLILPIITQNFFNWLGSFWN